MPMLNQDKREERTISVQMGGDIGYTHTLQHVHSMPLTDGHMVIDRRITGKTLVFTDRPEILEEIRKLLDGLDKAAGSLRAG